MRYIVKEKTTAVGTQYYAFDTLENVRVRLANGAFQSYEKSDAESKVAAMNAPSRPAEAPVAGISYVIRNAEAIGMTGIANSRTFATRGEAMDFADRHGIEHSRIEEKYYVPIDANQN